MNNDQDLLVFFINDREIIWKKVANIVATDRKENISLIAL